MKTRTRLTLLIILVVSFAVCLFAGCKIGEMDADEYLSKNDAADQCVTYFANGGRFNDNDKRDRLDMYYKADSYIMCSDTNNFKVSRTDHTFEAWYYVNVDSEGNVICDADGEPILGEKVKPTDKVQANQHRYVAASWKRNVAIRVHLITEAGFKVEDKDGNTYESGSVIKTINFGVTDSYGLTEKPLDAVNATYLYFFEDAECTKPIKTAHKPQDGDAEFVDVYAKYLKGDWKIVSTPSEVRNMFTYSYDVYNGVNYYLFSADGSGVIDCKNVSAVGLANSTFVINIEGNGVIIDNLRFSSDGLRGGKYSVLGSLGESSSIKNLTLRNVSVNATVASGNVELYLVCHGADNGAVLENFNIENASLEISASSSALILNMQGNNTDYWMFGGFDDGITDDGFVSQHGGVKVTNASLKLGGATLAENINKGN